MSDSDGAHPVKVTLEKVNPGATVPTKFRPMQIVAAGGSAGLVGTLCYLLVTSLIGEKQISDAFVRNKLLDALEKNSTAATANATANGANTAAQQQVAAKLTEFGQQQQRLVDKLTPLVDNLDALNNAVKDQTKAVRAEGVRAEAAREQPP